MIYLVGVLLVLVVNLTILVGRVQRKLDQVLGLDAQDRAEATVVETRQPVRVA